LEDRDDLWKLLVTITARKIYAQRRRATTEKRGGGKVRGESVFQRRDSEDDVQGGMAAILGNEPTPELANMLVENTQRCLECLDDENLREIAQLRLEGWTNDEIAKKQSCVRRTVERKLERIREKWSKMGLSP
jgi:DNA-directed RNA polymerase specialized sigma24 family protein